MSYLFSHLKANTFSKVRRSIFVLFILIILSAEQDAWAQIRSVTADQAPPIPHAGHDFIKSMNETVSPGVGAVNLQFGIDPPRGREISAPFAIGYDSNSAHHTGAMDNVGYLSQGGWRYVVPMLQYNTSVLPIFGSGGSTPVGWCDTVDHYIFTDLEGTFHPLGLNQSPESWEFCTGPGLVWPTPTLQNTDGAIIATTSGMGSAVGPNPLSPPVTVVDRDGTVYHFTLSPFHTANTYYSLTINGTTFTNHSGIGTLAVPNGLPDFIETRNGNKLTFVSDEQPGTQDAGKFHVVDTLGRTAVAVSGFGSPTGDTVSVSGFSQPYKLTWGASSFSFTINASLHMPPLPQFWTCNPGIGYGFGLLQGSGPVVTGLELPNGLSYQFQYDNPNGDNPYGLLRKMVYPNGAYVRYVWGLNPASTYETTEPINTPPSGEPNTPPPNPGYVCEYIYDTPAVAKRFVSFDGIHEVQEQDFTYATTWSTISQTDPNLNGLYQSWSEKQTTVTTTDLVTNKISKEVYTYAPLHDLAAGNDLINIIDSLRPSHPGEIKVQYEDAAGNVLRSISKTIGVEFAPPPDVMTTLENGQSSLMHMDFRKDELNTPTAVVTDQYQYDLGNTISSTLGNHGPLLEHIHADYNRVFPLNALMPPITSTLPRSNAISDRPSAVITYDGGGNRVAEIDYGYDETALLQAAATNHDDQNFSTSFLDGRGNATTQTRKCFLVPPTTQSCQDAVSVYTYDQSGQQITKQDPNGNLTTYSFDDSFFDPAPPTNAPAPVGNTNAFLTKITSPTTNGVSHVTSYSYAFSDGALTIATDENGNQTKYTYDDPLRRLTKADFPDGGQTLMIYNDAGASPNVVTSKKITDSSSLVTTSVMDGMGHLIQSQVNSVPLGPNFTDTTYDGMGRPRTVSNAHRSTALPTDGITTTDYDALGRVTQTTKQDGSISGVSYAANCQTATDEVGNKRRACSDALGRTIEVAEPTPGGAAAPGTASASVSGMDQSTQVATAGSGTVQMNGTVQWKTVSSASTAGTTNIVISGAEQQNPAGVTPGTGNVIISGSEQILAATTATATITIAGTLKSTQVQTQAATQATGSVSINGTDSIVPGTSAYDFGTVTVFIGTVSASTSYGNNGSSPTSSSTVASLLCNNITSTPSTSALATCTASGNVISLKAKASGTGGNVAVSVRAQTSFAQSSKSAFASSSAFGLSGGQNAVFTTVYDASTSTVTVAGRGDSYAWSGSGTTATSIASNLALAINNDTAAQITASASGATLALSAKSAGTAGNFTLTCSSGYDSAHFSAASFTISCPTALSGGTNAVSDVGTLSITVNSHTNSVPFNSSSSPATIAAALAANINADVTASVTATASGAQVNLTSITKGSISNYPFSTTISYDSGHFAQSSFATARSGATLTGGWPDPTAIDHGTMTVTVNGTNYQVNWGQTSTPGSIASGLANALGANATIAVTLSGTTISLDPKTASTSYSFATALTYDSANFTHPSFATTNSISDYGTTTVTVGGHQDSVPWGSRSTAPGIASALAGKINNDSTALVNAVASGITLTLTSRAAGAATNYTLTSANAFDGTHFSASSFASSNSGANLAGGKNAADNTVYDAGVVWITVNGFQASANYQQGSTPASIVNALAAAFNNPSSPVTAVVSGSALDLTAMQPGAASNYSLSAGATSNQPGLFIQPSFALSLSDTSLVGGLDGGPSNLSTPMLTVYNYDPLGNLLRVDQKGSAANDSTEWRTRLFTYDSLSHLISASNPESGLIQFTYDPNGNLLQKISPAPNQNGSATQTISYCYDALDRLTGKAYSSQACINGQLPNGTAVVTYTYDVGTNNIGKITTLTDLAGAASYTYDVMGRIATEQRTINPGFGLPVVTKGMTYTYNLDGSGKTLTYPSQAVLTYAVDGAGRQLSISDIGNGINYASAAAYNPDNRLSGFVSGQSGTFAGVSNVFTYNNRLQPVNISASSPNQTIFSIGYDFHFGSGDNGNVYGITNNKDATRNQIFTYDALNRLSSAQNAGVDCTVTLPNGKTKFWGNSYSYDAWGNLISKYVTKCAAENLNVLAMPTNHIAGYGYDAAGNMTQDVTTGLAYVYDAENRIANVNGTTYVYDADGNRIEKSSGGTGRLYWHMSPGVVAETDLAGNLQAEYVFFNRQRIARKDFPSTSVSYYFSDHLKTAAVISDSAGNIKSESDYYPWGGELQVTTGDTNHFKWTGHERDSESGLDYFGARYYGSGLSRFTSADSVGNDWEIADPQRWNLYVYARNNPLKYVDDLGEELKFADKELEAIVTQIRSESSDFDDALKGFEGKGAPDLTFKYGDAGLDANGVDKADGVTDSTFIVGGTFYNYTSATEYTTEHRDDKLVSSTITIDKSIKKDTGKTEKVVEHEVGHAHRDRTKPNESRKESEETKKNKGKVPHDQRPEEKAANEFRDKVEKQRKDSKKKQKDENKHKKRLKENLDDNPNVTLNP